jgi:hypothetical protein
MLIQLIKKFATLQQSLSLARWCKSTPLNPINFLFSKFCKGNSSVVSKTTCAPTLAGLYCKMSRQSAKTSNNYNWCTVWEVVSNPENCQKSKINHVYGGLHFCTVHKKKGIYDNKRIPHFKNLGRNWRSTTWCIIKITTVGKCLKI